MVEWLSLQGITTVLVTAAVLGLAKWGRTIDKSLSAHQKAAELLVERLNGHIALDEARHEAVTERIERVEEDIRYNGGVRRRP